jgi:hypothetical protein
MAMENPNYIHSYLKAIGATIVSVMVQPVMGTFTMYAI